MSVAMIVICPYCNQPAQLVGGDVIYPHLPWLHGKMFYSCVPCGAYVGCHDGTTQPLGCLANAQLRVAKMAAHTAFDPLWKSHRLTRTAAYRWLARELGIEVGDCHIGMFDVEQCRRVVEVCQKWQTDPR